MAWTITLSSGVIKIDDGNNYRTFAGADIRCHSINNDFIIEDVENNEFVVQGPYTEVTTPSAISLDDLINQVNIMISAADSSELAAMGDSSGNSAFGEPIAVTLTPILQDTFSYSVVNSEIYSTTLVGSGAASVTRPLATVNTTANTSSSAEISTLESAKYDAGQGLRVRFSGLYSTGAANSVQCVGLIDSDDGFAFGYNGAAFGVLHRNATSDTWIPQTTWLEDVADGTGSLPVMDFTKLNSFQIKFQYPSGAIRFYIEHPATGDFVMVHKIEYANVNTTASLSNPSLPLKMVASNSTNATDISVSVSSWSVFVEGDTPNLGPRRSRGNIKSAVGVGQFTNIITIQNKSTYQGVTNKVPIKVHFWSGAAENSGSNTTEVKLIRNATLAGVPIYTDVSTANSVVSFDIAGTDVTLGNEELEPSLSQSGEFNLPLTGDLEITLNPGETLTVAAEPSGGTATVQSALSWIELF